LSPPCASPSERAHRILLAVAAASFAPALGFHYVGEEAIFPIASLEMWYHGEWIRQLLYGSNLQHNPLFNWLIIPVAAALGWEHVLAVARAWTIGATLGTAALLAWLAAALYRDRAFALFCALVYLTLADVLFYRGWLAYADPLFAFFVAASIACLWVACERARAGWLAAAAAALTAAFMTKAFTAYVFYGGAALVLAASEARYRRVLLAPGSWVAHALAALAPFLWLQAVPQNAGQGARMFAEILAKLAPEDGPAYLAKLALYPLETLLRLAPAALVAGWLLWRRAVPADGEARHTRVALAIVALDYLPYWLAPQSAARYLAPLYPFFALILARPIWLAGAPGLALARRWIAVALAAKLVAAVALFPYYQKVYRGENYALVAREILERTRGHPLYTTNDSASGLSVVAHLDVLRLPDAPLTFPPQRWSEGFVIAYTPDPALGETVAVYRLGGNLLYLLCRGAACAAKPRAGS
jgi:4-amino-4-deoxy-L-arabinose transferase-like glycosyltransferase